MNQCRLLILLVAISLSFSCMFLACEGEDWGPYTYEKSSSYSDDILVIYQYHKFKTVYTPLVIYLTIYSNNQYVLDYQDGEIKKYSYKGVITEDQTEDIIDFILDNTPSGSGFYGEEGNDGHGGLTYVKGSRYVRHKFSIIENYLEDWIQKLAPEEGGSCYAVSNLDYYANVYDPKDFTIIYNYQDKTGDTEIKKVLLVDYSSQYTLSISDKDGKTKNIKGYFSDYHKQQMQCYSCTCLEARETCENNSISGYLKNYDKFYRFSCPWTKDSYNSADSRIDRMHEMIDQLIEEHAKLQNAQ